MSKINNYSTSIKWQKEHPVRVREIARTYRKRHPDRVRESRRRWLAKNPNKLATYRRDYSESHSKELKARKERWRAENPGYQRWYAAMKVKLLKEEIFRLLGNKCHDCGFDDVRALQKHHVSGCGNVEIQSFYNGGGGRIAYLKFVLEKIKSGSKEYELLCANCNWLAVKRREEAGYARATREKILSLLGGKCVVCGFSDKRALQIDELDGSGAENRRNGENYTKVLRDIMLGSQNYQILCANHNWIKRHENNEFRGKKYENDCGCNC